MQHYLKTYKRLETIGLVLSKQTADHNHNVVKTQTAACTPLYNQLFIISVDPRKGTAEQYLFNKQLLMHLGLFSGLNVGVRCGGFSKQNVQASFTKVIGANLRLFKVALHDQYAHSRTKAQLSIRAAHAIRDAALWSTAKQNAVDQHHLLGCLFFSPIARPVFIGQDELKQAYLAPRSPHALLGMHKRTNKALRFCKKLSIKVLLILLTNQ